MRRRIIGQGFEGFNLPQARGWRAVPEGDDVELMQGGELPRRRLVQVVEARSRGPAAFGRPLDRQGLLDQPDGQNIGRSVDLNAGAGGRLQGNILNLVGPDETARVVCITLGVERTTNALGVEQEIFARIQWGSGGVQNTADVDLQNGMVLQLSASSVRIEALGALASTGFFKVSAQVGYGIAGDKHAQRTVIVCTPIGAPTTLGLGVTSAVFAIPAFAKRVRIAKAPSTANCVFQALSRNPTNGLLAEYIIGNGPGSGSEDYPLPEAAVNFRIVNGMGAILTSLRAVFELHL